MPKQNAVPTFVSRGDIYVGKQGIVTWNVRAPCRAENVLNGFLPSGFHGARSRRGPTSQHRSMAHLHFRSYCLNAAAVEYQTGHALQNVPSFTTSRHESYSVGRRNRTLKCRSYWCIGEGSCDSNHLELEERLLLGISTPTSCKIAGTPVIQEGQTMNVHEDGFSAEAHGNNIAIFFLLLGIHSVSSLGGVSGRTDQLPRQSCSLHSRSLSTISRPDCGLG
ncbi:uncharacterized protein PADG_11761 [Paracoccidioides brasiliensis Pb18]|uniref:Uncharacterized protein n=1 Tax=Paracoccidioides brasiliensis (strain Pb18) TaxID=502780 RepID=A0A0A0HV86_PARBD|nr:uncharacterized protein PADG_11761 [Paracoccidioides brasiliensis Pb18]KGM92223.1 hypothetical protein PADG_11761 [Paracoccidioides brasiliensis Pb18]ODH52422.1 hypothetical protein GX48_01485 [Paracoccidioides brasiliensis]